MKNIYRLEVKRNRVVMQSCTSIVFFLLFFFSINNISAQVFSENVGAGAGTTAIASYTGWQNNGILTFTGSGDVRSTTPSSGYTGASGNGQVFLTNTIGQNFQIASINTTGLSGFVLSFGLFKSTVGSDATELQVEVSSDGVTYNTVSFPAQPTGSGTATWRLVTITGGASIPATANLRIRFTNTSSAVAFRIDDVVLNYSKYYKSINTGDWNGTTTWSYSPDGVAAYVSTANPPTSVDAKVEVMGTHTVTISTSGVSFKNAFVHSTGVLQLTTNSAYTIAGTGTNLTIESGANLLLNFPSTGTPSAISGSGTCLVKSGGTVTANNNSQTGFGAALGDNYLRTTSKFTYENNAVFDSFITSTTLPSSSSESYFTTPAATDLPILRISASPGFAYGSTGTTNTFNCLLQANAAFSFTSSGTKTFRGGFSGTSTINQGATGGQLILGTASVVPVLDGTITLNLTASGLSLVNGVTVPITTGNVIVNQSGSGAISKSAGNFTVNGTIDLTDVLVSNASGNVTVNGKLKTGNSSGFSGSAGTTVAAGTVVLNAGSTVEYNRAGAQSVTNAVSYQNIIFSGSGNKTAAVNFTVLQDLTISGSAALAPGSNTIFLAGNWTDYGTAGFTESTSTVDFNGAAAQSITTTGGEDFFKVKKSAAGTLTLLSDARFAGTSSELNISLGILDAGTFVLSGTASTTLTMSGGTLKLARLSVALPQFIGTYALSNGTIQLYGAGSQILSGGVVYRNLTFSNTTSTTLASNPTSIIGTVYITNSAILDIGSSNGFGDNNTNLTMDGGRFKMSGVSSSKPDIDGTFALTGGVVEFNGSGGSRQNIKGKNFVSADIGYQQIEVTGSNVGISTNNITLNAGGSFTVKNGGTYTMSDNAITGPTGSQTVTVENGGFFKTGNNEGFHGFTATLTNSSSLHTNIENIVLAGGSTVEYMRDGNQPITNSPALTYHHLTLSGTTGTKTAPASTLNINGNLTKTGACSFVHNNGIVVMNGSATQAYNSSYPVMVFYDLVNNNTVDLSTNNNMGIVHELSLGANSKLNLQSGNINLSSGPSVTARVAIIPSSATINYFADGKFTVERYLPSGISHAKSWQFLAVPTTGAQTINQAWQDTATSANQSRYAGYGTQITSNISPLPGMFDVYTPSAPSMKTYDPSTNGWIGVANTTTLPIYNQKGYMVFVRGDRTVTTYNGTANSTILRSSGKIFDPVSNLVPVTNIGSTEFETIGNPYASEIDFSNDIGVVKSANVQKVFYVWDPKLSGIYGYGAFQTFTRGIGLDNNYYVSPGGGSYGTSGSVNNTIQSGQAFIVHTFGGTGTVSFTEDAKSTGSSVVFKPGNTEDLGNTAIKQLRCNLSVIINNEPVLIDGVLSQFKNNFSNLIDRLDAVKIANFAENIAISQNNKLLAVERRSLITNTDTIFYKLGQLKVHQYRFEFTPANIARPGLQAFLEDNFLNTRTQVSLTDTSRIIFAVNNVPGSAAPGRFRLVFKQRHTAITNTREEPVEKKASISVYPNPVSHSDVINLHFTDQPEGKYLLQLANQSGQVILESTANVNGRDFTHSLKLPAAPAGIYRLTIMGPGQVKFSKQITVY